MKSELARDQGVVLLHEARFSPSRIVRVDNAAVRNLVEGADRLDYCYFRRLGVSLANRQFRLLHVSSGFCAIWAISKSLLLVNPDTLLSRFAVRQR